MYKLNLVFTEANKTDAQKKLEKVSQWANPIGWWSVTTEGDVEGHTITALGQFYGHIAEIAFSLAGKSCYSLNFNKVKGMCDPPGVVTYVAQKRKVNISFLGGPFSSNLITTQKGMLAKWMDAEGVQVKDCNYYSAVTLTI